MADRFLPKARTKPGLERHNVDSVKARRLNLLIVEDIQEDVELIAIALDTAGWDFQYEVIDSLERCQALLKRQQFDAVLADYRLPGLHAPQVFQLVNKQQPLVPFILVTGSLGEAAAVECIKAGMTDYVLKDSLYRLPSVLRRALAEAELKRQQKVAITHIGELAWRESAVNRIVQAIRETLVLEDIQQIAVDQLRRTLKADQCMIVRPSSEQRMLIQAVSDLSSGKNLLNQPWTACEVFKAELMSGQHVLLYQTDIRLPLPVAEFLERQRLISTLMMPLSYQNRYFGALVVNCRKRKRAWKKNEISLVKAVAEQCAISTYQAELYARAQQELSQRRKVEEQLRHDAFHDGLTGLPNRALFLDRLNHALQISHRRQSKDSVGGHRKFAVLFLDLDDFRIVNDSLGHDAGDFLLQIVAVRLQQCLRAGDTLARTSGDEFAVLLEDVVGIDEIVEVVENIQCVLRHPVMLGTQEIFISSCIGIVIDALSYENAAQFLRDADTAMYQAKSKGRSSYQVFNWTMHTEVKRRLQLENDLRRALAHGEFSLVYQPIMHLPSQQLCGFEALIRWHSPDKGVLSPDEFIPVAEQTGLIVPIGHWVMRHACAQWQRWSKRWPSQLEKCSISINLSAKQFVQSNLVFQIEEILQVTGVAHHQLRIEITETALIENETASLETLRQLKAKRIKVALDDFGTGYSSLSYLLRFPKDALKIDKSFVSNLDNNSGNQEIIKTILALGADLGLDVVAEGIETERQAQFLMQKNCVYGQGNWFSSPLTSTHAEEMLKAYFEPENTP